MKCGDWISVKTCLPPRNTRALVLISDQLLLVGYWFVNEDPDWITLDGRLIQPSHWTPLPEVPSELR